MPSFWTATFPLMNPRCISFLNRAAAFIDSPAPDSSKIALARSSYADIAAIGSIVCNSACKSFSFKVAFRVAWPTASSSAACVILSAITPICLPRLIVAWLSKSRNGIVVARGVPLTPTAPRCEVYVGIFAILTYGGPKLPNALIPDEALNGPGTATLRTLG